MKDDRDSIVKTRFVDQFVLTQDKLPELDYALWHKKIDPALVIFIRRIYREISVKRFLCII